VNAALASGDARQIEALKELLQGYNELGSDLDANGRVPSSALAPLNGASSPTATSSAPAAVVEPPKRRGRA
jgi:hypothetical protein